MLSSKRNLFGLILIVALVGGSLWRWRADGPASWHRLSRVGLHTEIDIQWQSKKDKGDVVRGLDSLILLWDSQFSENFPSHPFYKLARTRAGQNVVMDSKRKFLLDFFLKQNHALPDSANGYLQLGAAEWLYRLGLLEETPANPGINERERDSLKALMGSEYFTYDAESGVLKTHTDSLHLTLGSVSKGYGILEMARWLEIRGIANYLINAGGDMQYSGKNPKGLPWHIGVRNPRGSPGELLGVISVPEGYQGIATSGDYENSVEVNGKRFHHLINGKNGEPATDKKSVTVIAENSLVADFYSTLLFILPLENALKFLQVTPGLEYLIIPSEGDFKFSSVMERSYKTMASHAAK